MKYMLTFKTAIYVEHSSTWHSYHCVEFVLKDEDPFHSQEKLYKFVLLYLVDEKLKNMVGSKNQKIFIDGIAYFVPTYTRITDDIIEGLNTKAVSIANKGYNQLRMDEKCWTKLKSQLQ